MSCSNFLSKISVPPCLLSSISVHHSESGAINVALPCSCPSYPWPSYLGATDEMITQLQYTVKIGKEVFVVKSQLGRYLRGPRFRTQAALKLGTLASFHTCITKPVASQIQLLMPE